LNAGLDKGFGPNYLRQIETTEDRIAVTNWSSTLMHFITNTRLSVREMNRLRVLGTFWGRD